MDGDHRDKDPGETVAQLHQTLVVLRKELELKNQIIRDFKATTGPGVQGQQSGPKSFEEMFEPLIDVDQIMLFEDLQKQQEEERERQEKRAEAKRLRDFRSGPPTHDPILAFVISEDEEEEASKQETYQRKTKVEKSDTTTTSTTTNNCSKLQLVPNEHIVIHETPSHEEGRTPCSTPERPVLRSPTSGSESARSCSGSQTDITAIELKNWHSEPYSLHKKVSTARRSVSNIHPDGPHGSNNDTRGAPPAHLQRSVSSENDPRQLRGRYKIQP